MKTLNEWTESELQAASDRQLGILLAEHFFGMTRPYAENLTNSSNWSSTGNGMLEVLEAMKAHIDKDLGYSLEWQEGFHTAHFWIGNRIQGATHPTSLPRAVAVAALLAVKEKCSR